MGGLGVYLMGTGFIIFLCAVNAESKDDMNVLTGLAAFFFIIGLILGILLPDYN